jgi:hypothetical protein
MSVVALLTNSDGSTIGPAAYASNPDGTAPALIGIGGASSMVSRGADSRRVLAVLTDWYALMGTAAAPGESADADVSVAGRASPGLANPGDPGGALTAVVYAYSYAYSAPALTPVGER